MDSHEEQHRQFPPTPILTPTFDDVAETETQSPKDLEGKEMAFLRDRLQAHEQELRLAAGTSISVSELEGDPV